MVTSAVDEMLERARSRIRRLGPEHVDDFLRDGGVLVDIRPEAQRQSEGAMPGAIVIERNVLEWRFDPTGEYSIAEASDYERPILVLCSEGYASSFAAASLADLGFRSVGDLAGGYQAWKRHKEAS
ncbi:MAG: rhodanese-like domain-containing protein [Acidimicrobiales bacterium]|jgi:rhodanese-related sulfurtransferase